jgi:hypothetical protein
MKLLMSNEYDPSPPGSHDSSVTSDEESSICLSSPEYQFMSSDDEEGLWGRGLWRHQTVYDVIKRFDES